MVLFLFGFPSVWDGQSESGYTDGGSWNSGYLYNSKEIRCFSHVHCWQLAGVPVMPTTGEITGHKGMDAYKSAYSHDSEIVKPGYHKVELDKYKIGVELTSTARVGMHRYTYPAGEKANVLFDVGALLAHGKTEKAAIHRISSKEIGGYSVLAPTSRRKKPVTVYFVARFNQNMTEFGGWEKEGRTRNWCARTRLKERISVDMHHSIN